MAYTAIESMRQENRIRFGADIGPFQPPLFQNPAARNDLKSASLRFLHDRCEGLRFDPGIESEERSTGALQGKSIRPGQIPYNMEMDLDRLCLEKAAEAFLDSGTAEDAYTVYYCFLEMFLGPYGDSKLMVELLSEYESNGSSLLLKHRDHYSHSVYVFVLGLALYETNETYRAQFRTFYQLNGKPEKEAACLFLEYWGLASLFHDIGYPFELPFEQVISYFEVDNRDRGKDCPFLAYRAVETITSLDSAAEAHFKALYGKPFHTVMELLAHDIAAKLGSFYGFSETDLLNILNDKVTRPERFGYYIDHAFFSSIRLYRRMEKELGAEFLTPMHIDALSAILLHNSLFKFSIAFYKDDSRRKPPLRAEMHPLAWLLMLCDELQCWDRIAYGRNSRSELHPMAADFDFSGNAVHAFYYFDQDERGKIAAFRQKYWIWEKNGKAGDPPRLKAYSDMAEKEQRFTADIAKTVDLSGISLTVTPGLRRADRRRKHLYLSSSSFLHLYDFAVALHGRNLPPDTDPEVLEKKFSSQSLEYQLSGINRAKGFSRYLDAIGCFYTDRPVDYDMVPAFTPEQAAVIAPLEHERWVREHLTMGWRFGMEYETLPLPEDSPEARRALREQLRCHRLAMDGDPSSEEIRMHYFDLPEEDQDKDWKPFNRMLKLLKKFDGLRIYQFGPEKDPLQ